MRFCIKLIFINSKKKKSVSSIIRIRFSYICQLRIATGPKTFNSIRIVWIRTKNISIPMTINLYSSMYVEKFISLWLFSFSNLNVRKLTPSHSLTMWANINLYSSDWFLATSNESIRRFLQIISWTLFIPSKIKTIPTDKIILASISSRKQCGMNFIYFLLFPTTVIIRHQSTRDTRTHIQNTTWSISCWNYCYML